MLACRPGYEGCGYGAIVDIVFGILGGVLDGSLFGVLGLWPSRVVGAIIVTFVGAIILVGISLLRRI